MELYALVDTSTNKIKVGPRMWNIKFWKRFLDNENITFDDYPPNPEFSSFVCIDIPESNYKIMPVLLSDPPNYDSFHQELSGPYYTINVSDILGIYTIVDKNLDGITYNLKKQASNERYIKEIGGILIGGITVATDRESQSMLSSVRLRSDTDNSLVINWKGENGWFPLDRTMIVAISDGIFDFVESCFADEKNFHEDIDNAVTIGNRIQIITELIRIREEIENYNSDVI